MKAKLDYMQKDAEDTGWESVENGLVTQWYFVSKIMAHLIPPQFPYFTFKGISEEIQKDPNFKSNTDEQQPNIKEPNFEGMN